jgi:hypothetical protein
LFGYGFEGGMRVKKSESGGEAVIGDTKDADAAVVMRNVFDEPFNCVVGISGFVGGFGVGEIDLGGKVEGALGFEAAAEVLDDEDVAIVREFRPSGRGWARAVCRGRRRACGRGERAGARIG